MATELNYDKLVKDLKANPELKQSEAAQKQGLTIGQVSMVAFTKAQVEAGIYKKAPGTPPSVKKLRDSEGNRWELIAARTGLGVSAVKAAYEEAGGNASNSYTGRGRNFAGGGSGRKSGAAKKTAAKSGAKKTTAARKTGVKTTTARRGATKKTAPVRNIRGGRSGRAANPS